MSAEGGNAPGPSIPTPRQPCSRWLTGSDLHGSGRDRAGGSRDQSRRTGGSDPARAFEGLAVGAGMQSRSGVAATLFAAMGRRGIRIANITTSERSRSRCIVDERDAEPVPRERFITPSGHVGGSWFQSSRTVRFWRHSPCRKGR